MTDLPKKELFMSIENHMPDFAWTIYQPPYPDTKEVVVIRMTPAGATEIKWRLEQLLLRDKELREQV